MKWIGHLAKAISIVLLLGLGSTADALPVATNQILRGDFDFSGFGSTGPYDFLRTELFFTDFLQPNEFIVVSIFDAQDQPATPGNTVVNNFGFPINNIGFENPLIPPALADGIGFVLFQFSQPIQVDSVNVRGVIQFDGIDGTPLVPAKLSVSAIPEPGTLLLMVAGLARMIAPRSRIHRGTP